MEPHKRVMEFEKKRRLIINCGLRATLRNPSDCSVLSHSLNRVYLVRASPLPKFLPSVGTSDILKPLGEMLTTGAKYKKRKYVKSKEVKNANKKFL
jgi:hypothetical protein